MPLLRRRETWGSSLRALVEKGAGGVFSATMSVVQDVRKGKLHKWMRGVDRGTCEMYVSRLCGSLSSFAFVSSSVPLVLDSLVAGEHDHLLLQLFVCLFVLGPMRVGPVSRRVQHWFGSGNKKERVRRRGQRYCVIFMICNAAAVWRVGKIRVFYGNSGRVFFNGLAVWLFRKLFVVGRRRK